MGKVLLYRETIGNRLYQMTDTLQIQIWNANNELLQPKCSLAAVAETDVYQHPVGIDQERWLELPESNLVIQTCNRIKEMGF